jgi:tuftelin-interacting protein 11
MDVDSIPELPQASKANELESDEGSSFDDSDEEEDEDRQRAPARERDEEESEEEGMAPPMRGFGSGGIGSSTRAAATTSTPSAPEASFSHPIGGGIGSSSSSAPRTSGIGFKPSGPSSSTSNSIPPPASLSSSSSVPTAFGSKPKPPPTSRFARPKSPPRAFSPSTVNLSAADKQAFRKMEGSFGARMLAKQGWQAGSGLGATGEGMVTPIQVVQRGQGMGLGAGGFKERSEASRKEAVRKGEIKVDEDEGGKGKKGKKSGGLRKGTFGEEGGEKKEKQESWRKSKKVNLKPVHKTYEELVAEAGEMGHAGGVGMIIDATGATVRPSSFFSLPCERLSSRPDISSALLLSSAR